MYQKHLLNKLVCVYPTIYDCSYAFISPEKRPKKRVCIVGKGKEEKVNNLFNKYIKFNLGTLGTCTCAIIAVDEVIERLKLFKIVLNNLNKVIQTKQ